MRAYTKKEYKHHKSRFDLDLRRKLPHCAPDPEHPPAETERESLICPLCDGFAYRAVRLQCCGSVFCKRCLVFWFESGRGTKLRRLYHRCPVCASQVSRIQRVMLRTNHHIARKAATAAALEPERAALLTPINPAGALATEDKIARERCGLPPLSPMTASLPRRLRVYGRRLRGLEPPAPDAEQTPPEPPVDVHTPENSNSTCEPCSESVRLMARQERAVQAEPPVAAQTGGEFGEALDIPPPPSTPPAERATPVWGGEQSEETQAQPHPLPPVPTPCRRAAAAGLSATPSPMPTGKAITLDVMGDEPPDNIPVIAQVAPMEANDVPAPRLVGAGGRPLRATAGRDVSQAVAAAACVSRDVYHSDRHIRARRAGLWTAFPLSLVGMLLLFCCTVWNPVLCYAAMASLLYEDIDTLEGTGPYRDYWNELFHPTDDQVTSRVRRRRSAARQAAADSAAELAAAEEAQAREEAERCQQLMLAAIEEQVGEPMAFDESAAAAAAADTAEFPGSLPRE